MSRYEDRFSGQQYVGDRESQQDDFGFVDASDLMSDGAEHSVLILADGMGGHAGGDLASATAARAFVETYPTRRGPITDRLREATYCANHALAEISRQHPDMENMGTTLLGASVCNGELHWVSVGDSLLYLYRRGELKRLNADHSMGPVLAEMVVARELTEQEAAESPSRNALRSSLTGADISMLDVSSQPVALESGDQVMVASDGLATLTTDTMAEVLSDSNVEPRVRVTRLLDLVAAEEREGQDNTTVLVYDYVANEEHASSPLPQPVSDDTRMRISSATNRWQKPRLIFPVVLTLVAVASAWFFWPSANMGETGTQDQVQGAEPDSTAAPAPDEAATPATGQGPQPEDEISPEPPQDTTEQPEVSGGADELRDEQGDAPPHVDEVDPESEDKVLHGDNEPQESGI